MALRFDAFVLKDGLFVRRSFEYNGGLKEVGSRGYELQGFLVYPFFDALMVSPSERDASEAVKNGVGFALAMDGENLKAAGVETAMLTEKDNGFMGEVDFPFLKGTVILKAYAEDRWQRLPERLEENLLLINPSYLRSADIERVNRVWPVIVLGRLLDGKGDVPPFWRFKRYFLATQSPSRFGPYLQHLRLLRVLASVHLWRPMLPVLRPPEPKNFVLFDRSPLENARARWLVVRGREVFKDL